MIRIATTQIATGDVIRSYGFEGTVTKGASLRYSEWFTVEVDGTPHRMRDCGSVELLSELGDREPCKSFGRW